MNTKAYFYIVFRILLLGALGIMFTYVPEHLRGFFGDHLRNTSIYSGRYETSGMVDQNWTWGARHYWFFWISTIIFILSVVKIWFDFVDFVEKLK